MGNLLPLAFLNVSQKAIVKEITGGRRCCRRLQAMGINIGSAVCLVQKEPNGPVILSVGDCRVAVGQGMAQKVLVQETWLEKSG